MENSENYTENKCRKAGHEQQDPHLCPYADEINDDKTLCTCCKKCERDCCDDI